MSEEQFKEVLTRFDHIEEKMVKKSDMFQTVWSAQCFVLAVVVGVLAMTSSIVVLG